ncbi:ATP-binding protein [Streptomyces mangrovisoli]|uniref:ATP-binding protein n=1 Tax=Streptomyces mangrovisoli TaxID=1428628 RepID=UPI0030B7F69A
MKAARDAVRERLFAWGQPGDLCMDAVLLVSELATNAVLHAAGGTMLCGLVLTGDGCLRLEVHDEEHERIALPDGRPDRDAENGRGLLLVRQIATAWGVRRSTRTTGNAVWAVLRAGG